MEYFVWNVDPVIFHVFGPLYIRWYSLLFLSGILVGNFLFLKMLKSEGRPLVLKDTLLYYIVIGTVVGARLGHCFFYNPSYYLSNPLEIIQINKGGLASHGGYLGVLIAVFLFSRKHKEMSFFWLMDRLCIVSILAGAFIRLGNFFNSEIIGHTTDVSWAIVFPLVDQLPRHPTQLYESIGYGAISLLLYLVYRYYDRRPLEGRILGCAMIVAFCFRFFIEHFKENQEAYEADMLLNMGQYLSIPFILVGLFLAVGLQHKFPYFAWGLTPKKKEKPQKLAKRKKA